MENIRKWNSMNEFTQRYYCMLDCWQVPIWTLDYLRTSNEDRPHSSRPKRSPSAASWLWPAFDLGSKIGQTNPVGSNGFPIKTMGKPMELWDQVTTGDGIWGSALVLLKLCDAVVFLLHLLMRVLIDSAAASCYVTLRQSIVRSHAVGIWFWHQTRRF